MISQIKEAIETAAPGTIIWDKGERASVNGLCARILESGRVSFYFYYRTRAGQQRKPKLGTFGEITVAEARARAKALAKRVAIGEDPRGDWENKRQELTVAALYDAARENHWTAGKVSEKWLQQVEMNWKNHLAPAFGTLKATDLQPKDVKAWLRGYEETPYAGNRSLEVLSKVYRHAQEEGLVPLGVNPCAFVKALPERKRGRYATPAEMRAIRERLDHYAESRPAMVAYTYLLIFSGARPSVITRATWEQLEEIEIEGETWGRLRLRGKTSHVTGEEDVTILPPPAMAVVKRLPRVPGATLTGVRQPQKFWELVRKEAGCPDLWIRDFRRTFATVGLSEGEKLDTIAELLNHKSTQTTKIYAKLMDHARFKAAGSIAGKLAALLAPAPALPASPPEIA